MKLVIEERESDALEHHLSDQPLLATSRIACVEVLRATALANRAAEIRAEAETLLSTCILVELGEGLLRAAAGLASASIRTLDAIHLASALRVGADEFVVYDRRLASAGADHGLTVTSPGALGP